MEESNANRRSERERSKGIRESEIRRLVDSLERTDSLKLIVDYGKSITRMLKELATYRKLRNKD